jgi:hypothetical protein
MCSLCGLRTKVPLAEFTRSGRKDWYCHGCSVCPAVRSELLGRGVHVYWQPDDCWYPGVITAYEPLSRKHMVVYEDNEWEFLSLTDQEIHYDEPTVAQDLLGEGD